MAQPPTGPPAGLPDLGQGMELAHGLVQQNKPMEALLVMTGVLRAMGMGREADQCMARVQQALAGGGSAGTASNDAMAELAGLMSMISLQAPQPGQPSNPAQHPQQQQQQQQQQAGASSGAAGMEVEGAAEPGPPGSGSSAGGGDSPSQLGRLVAAAEGETFECPQCGGLVSVERGQAHQQLWCPAVHPR